MCKIIWSRSWGDQKNTEYMRLQAGEEGFLDEDMSTYKRSHYGMNLNLISTFMDQGTNLEKQVIYLFIYFYFLGSFGITKEAWGSTKIWNN